LVMVQQMLQDEVVLVVLVWLLWSGKNEKSMD
jgi:hypothetical protein